MQEKTHNVFFIFQSYRKETDASLEDQLKEAAEKTAAMHISEKKKERKGSESKDSKKEVKILTFHRDL